MKNIQLTQQEANALLQLIDFALKANGINVAQAGLHLTNKIQEAFKEEPETEEVEEEAK